MGEKRMLTKAEINEVVIMLNHIQGEILAYTEHACKLIDGCIEWLDDNHESAPTFTAEEDEAWQRWEDYSHWVNISEEVDRDE